ncbi:hypothetical protein A2U01_0062748, partial [Trifolium medium]|nr:hypothetical protein [Trifolium medium]
LEPPTASTSVTSPPPSSPPPVNTVPSRPHRMKLDVPVSTVTMLWVGSLRSHSFSNITTRRNRNV